MILKAYKYRLYPNKKQTELINKHLGATRFIYNLALETKITAYKSAQKKLSSFDLCYQLTELKKEVTWLNELDSQALQASIKNIDKAFKNFFNGAGYPKYKSRKGHQSYQCPHEVKRVNWELNTLTIPKIKNIPIVLSQKFEGKIKTITISKTPTNKYFASILVEEDKTIPNPPTPSKNKTLGVDLGLKEFLITSEGDKIGSPYFLRNKIGRIKVLQCRMRNKKKGSNNYKKAHLQINKVHEYINNSRNNFLQELSTKLVCENQATTFCFESLAVKNMVKNHKLAQAINDVSWAKFVSMMKYKCEWYGKNFIQINPFAPSTKTCYQCKAQHPSLTLKDRYWTCTCGVTHDRDINAAKNIKFMGLAGLRKPIAPVEKRTMVRSKKQELFLKG